MDLKAIRKEKRMTQSEVAEAVGIKRLRYQTYESGKRQPKPEMAMRIAEVLDFDWTEFFKEAENDEGAAGGEAGSGTC